MERTIAWSRYLTGAKSGSGAVIGVLSLLHGMWMGNWGLQAGGISPANIMCGQCVSGRAENSRNDGASFQAVRLDGVAGIPPLTLAAAPCFVPGSGCNGEGCLEYAGFGVQGYKKSRVNSLLFLYCIYLKIQIN